MVGYSQGGLNVANQFGMPLYGCGGLLPYGGNYFWVDATNGSDGNTGGPTDPFKTLAQALTACLSGNNDVILFTGTYSPTATLAWSKNRTHLIGLGQASIAVASTAATSGAFSPLVNVTGTDCIFQNFTVTSGIAQAATQVAWAEAGGRNSYTNVKINQVGHATAAAQAGNRALTLASTGNTFTNCVLGSDAIVRATNANASIEFLDASGDCVFQSCIIPAWCSAAGDTFITTASTALVGYFVFNGCLFINNINNTAGTALTVGIVMAAASKGILVLGPTTTVGGVTAVSAASAGVQVSGGTVTAASSNRTAAQA